MATFINKWKDSLSKTRKIAFSRIYTLFGTNQINDALWEELVTILIQSDLGVELSDEIIEGLQAYVKQNGVTEPEDLIKALKRELLSNLNMPPILGFNDKEPVVILVVGVNGSGKTTTVAKLGKFFKEQNKSVLFAASDTFRAAAVEQLKYWGDLLNIPVVSGHEGSDPGAIAYDAISSAKSKKIDRVIIDTAGRLHTKYNLMEELKKVNRVVSKAMPGAPHAVWLVLDATTGQNAFQQAISFKNDVDVTGVILAKLDTSAKGGMAFAIQKKLQLPILYAGLGEGIDDLKEFDPDAFVQGILSE